MDKGGKREERGYPGPRRVGNLPKLLKQMSFSTSKPQFKALKQNSKTT